MARLLKLLIKIVLSAGLIWYAFRNVDVAAAMTYLRGVPSSAVVAALAVLFVGFIIAALRLRLIFHLLGYGCTPVKALEVVLIGAFFSQTLVSFVGGDAMRIWRMPSISAPRRPIIPPCSSSVGTPPIHSIYLPSQSAAAT